MRLVFSLLLVLAHLAFTGAGHGQTYEMTCEPMACQEGGPVSIKCVLTYRGAVPLRIVDSPDPSDHIIAKTTPPGWTARKTGEGTAHIGAVPTRQLTPGESIHATVQLHQRYAKIAAGRITLALVWRIRVQENEGFRDYDAALKSVELDLLPATSILVDQVIKQWRDDLAQAKALSDTRAAWKSIGGIEHEAVCIAAIDQLAAHRSIVTGLQVRPWLYDMSQSSKLVQRRLIQYLKEHGNREDAMFFVWWWGDKVTLDRALVNELLGSNNLWIRALTLRTFSKQTTAQSKRALLEELDELKQLISRE